MKTHYYLALIALVPTLGYPATPATEHATPATAPIVQQPPALPSSPPAPAANSNDAQTLAALTARIPILTAQAEIAELEARIRNANGKQQISGPGSLTSPLPAASAPARVATIAAAAAADIEVSSIRSYNHVYSAWLQVNGALLDPVSVGDAIYIDGTGKDGWRVASISDSEVRISRNGSTRVLRMK